MRQFRAPVSAAVSRSSATKYVKTYGARAAGSSSSSSKAAASPPVDKSATAAPVGTTRSSKSLITAAGVSALAVGAGAYVVSEQPSLFPVVATLVGDASGDKGEAAVDTASATTAAEAVATVSAPGPEVSTLVGDASGDKGEAAVDTASATTPAEAVATVSAPGPEVATLVGDAAGDKGEAAVDTASATTTAEAAATVSAPGPEVAALVGDASGDKGEAAVDTASANTPVEAAATVSAPEPEATVHVDATGDIIKSDEETDAEIANAAEASSDGVDAPAKIVAELDTIGSGNRVNTELAEVLADMERLFADVAHGSEDRISELRNVQGLTPEEFARAVVEWEKGPLETRAVELVSAMVDHVTEQENRFRQALSEEEAHITARSLERVAEAIHRLNLDKDRELQERRELMEAEFSERKHRALSQIAREAEAQTHALMKEMQSEATKVCQERVWKAWSTFEQRLGAAAGSVAKLDGLVEVGPSPHRSKSSHTLSAALVALEAALARGQPPHEELVLLRKVADNDSFVSRVLRSVPSETVEWCRGPVPTELQLRKRFSDELGSLVAAAFAPSHHGLLSSALAQFTGWVFRKLYVLKAAEDGVNEFASDGGIGANQTGFKATHQNLATLSRASGLVEAGEILVAVATLEGLSGECRARASTWISEAKHTLLVLQAARVVHSKVRCLNTVLE